MLESRTVGSWIREIRAGWPALAGTVVVCLVLAVVATIRQPDLYGATGAVVVSPERFLQSEGTDALPALTENVVRLSSTQAVLLPAAQAYARAGGTPDETAERRRTATLKWLRDHVKVQEVGTSSVVEITGTATTRDQAMDLTRSVVEALTRFVRETRGDQPSPTGEPEPPSGLIVLSSAESEGRVSPTPVRNLFVGLNLGLLIGALLALVLGRARLRSDPSHVADSLGVPLLAVARGGRGGEEEAITAAQRVLEGRARDGSMVVLLTGTANPDRIAQVATRLGVSLCLGTGKRALLVDGDLSGRAMSRQLRLADRPGVSDLLVPGVNSNELEQSVVPLYEPSDESATMAVLPAGPPVDVGDATDIARFPSVIEPLKDEFDFFVVTGPDVTKTNELFALVSTSQYCLLVTDGGVSPQRLAAARALRQDARPGAMGLIALRAPRRWLQLSS